MAKKAKKPELIRYTGNSRVRVDGYGKIFNGDTVSHTAVSDALFEYLESRNDFEQVGVKEKPEEEKPVVEDVAATEEEG